MRVLVPWMSWGSALRALQMNQATLKGAANMIAGTEAPSTHSPLDHADRADRFPDHHARRRAHLGREPAGLPDLPAVAPVGHPPLGPPAAPRRHPGAGLAPTRPGAHEARHLYLHGQGAAGRARAVDPGRHARHLAHRWVIHLDDHYYYLLRGGGPTGEALIGAWAACEWV
jgi:hypothetical protein